jgi:hypothetical protein
MKRRLPIVLSLALLVPAGLLGQSSDFPPLGDLARSLRHSPEPETPVVIDNDNLSQIMDQVESHRLSRSPLFSFDGAAENFRMSSPDGTCSLSFNANATSLLAMPYLSQDLPQSELAKLDGPAVIDGNTLQISIFNATNWNVKEITVGLTIVRRGDDSAGLYGRGRLVPAAETENLAPAGKPSDLTVLLHLKGTAEPLQAAVFQEKLGTDLAPGQEWHWAIIQAKGIPPTPLSTMPGNELEFSAPVVP